MQSYSAKTNRHRLLRERHSLAEMPIVNIPVLKSTRYRYQYRRHLRRYRGIGGPSYKHHTTYYSV